MSILHASKNLDCPHMGVSSNCFMIEAYSGKLVQSDRIDCYCCIVIVDESTAASFLGALLDVRRVCVMTRYLSRHPRPITILTTLSGG